MKQNLNGFTLIETVLVIFLFSIVLGTVVVLFNNHNKIYNYEQALFKTSGTARTILNEISAYGFQANRVVASHSVNGTVYVSGANSVVFQVPSVDGSGQVVPNSWDYAAFYMNGSHELDEQVEAGAGSVRPSGMKQLSQSVSGITFSYDNPDWALVRTVSVDLQTESQAEGETVSSHTNQKVYLRNY